MTFEDLKGCLILLSYDTVRPEDESQTWHNVLPYTFEDGCLLRYELDGDDDIDHTIDLDNYAVAQRTPFDLDEFEKVNDLLIMILLTEGKEIIREAPFNEEDVVDNRITLTLYDESRNEILSRSRKIGRSALPAGGTWAFILCCLSLPVPWPCGFSGISQFILG